MEFMFTVFFFLMIFVLVQSVKIVTEYDRLVVFRLGRAIGVRGPGLILLIPMLETAKKVDLRVITMAIPMQEIITKDNVSAKTAAVCFFQIVDPYKAVTKIEDPVMATNQIAQTTLRSVLGQHDLDHLLSDRDIINAKLQSIIDRQTEPWGIKVVAVEVKDVEIPEQMKRAMARQAEAERERRAKIVAAEGELQAAEKLAAAAHQISASPGAMQLRQLQTMVEVSAEKNSTLIFPIPIELLEFARNATGGGNYNNRQQQALPYPPEERPSIRVSEPAWQDPMPREQP
jgi:regulator of protease activity HflC (stomatin/prohibitin superfamily)